MSSSRTQDNLPEPAAAEEAAGELQGEWYYEEHAGAIRLGMRVRSRLHTEVTPYQKIDVYDTEFFGRLLTLDDLVMLTERDEFVYHEMLVHVPLCSLQSPKSVLIIGGGDTGCVREALKHPSVERIVQCEIDERVTELSRQFFAWPEEVLANPRAEFVFADGVEYIHNHPGEFDLIIIDSTDPIGPAVGLFREEFYRACARALKPGGVLTAQTESPHWDADVVGAIQAEMRKAFEHVALYCGWIPTYPSGMWTWSYCSNARPWDAYLDLPRAQEIARDAMYYNPEIHRAAFVLPNFARRATEGEDCFRKWWVRPESA